MWVMHCWGTYLLEYAPEMGGRKTRKVARTLRRLSQQGMEAGWWCGGPRGHNARVVPPKFAGRVKLPNFRSWTPESITGESRHNLTILENACISVSWWIILMIIWTKVQKCAHCQCQRYFSPGVTLSGIFRLLNVWANFWINRKANFHMNGDLWVWEMITCEIRQEVLMDSNYQFRISFSPGGPNLRHPPNIGQY